MIVFRVQDKDGRGPWKPGFSDQWVEDRDDLDNLIPWPLQFGRVDRLGIAGMAMGTACSSLEQLRRWFTPTEYARLKGFGYQAFQMEVGRILGQSDIQLFFERVKPLREDVLPVELYSLEVSR